MSALEDLTKALQAAADSVESAQADVGQAQEQAASAVAAAQAYGREDDVLQADALRSDIEEQAGALAAAKQTMDELTQRAVALQSGN